MRASERAALEENGEEVEELPLEREKSKVFGKMKQRRKVLVDVEWRMRWTWTEILYALKLCRTGVVGFKKALVGLHTHNN
jgi:hypothetical protein